MALKMMYSMVGCADFVPSGDTPSMPSVGSGVDLTTGCLLRIVAESINCKLCMSF